MLRFDRLKKIYKPDAKAAFALHRYYDLRYTRKMLHWLAYAAFLVTLCTALPSPSPQPQPQSQSRAPQGPVRAEVGAILATFDPNSDQRDYIFIFNGYNSADRLIRQTGCYHNMQPYGPDILCLDANAYDGGIIEADPSRGKRAFESVRRFRDFLLSGEDNGAPGYRTPQFQLRSMQPTILAQKNGGLEFDFRVELLNKYVFVLVSLIPLSGRFCMRCIGCMLMRCVFTQRAFKNDSRPERRVDPDPGPGPRDHRVPMEPGRSRCQEHRATPVVQEQTRPIDLIDTK